MSKRYGGLYSIARKVEKKSEKAYKKLKKASKKAVKKGFFSKTSASKEDKYTSSRSDKRQDHSERKYKQRKGSSKPEYKEASSQPSFANKGLLVPAVLWLFLSLNDGPMMILAAIFGCGLWTLSVWFLSEGQKASAAYAAHKIAKRPAFPRKIFAALLMGLSVGFAITLSGSAILSAMLYGLVACLLMLGAYGIDPLSDKGKIEPLSFEEERVFKVTQQAQEHLSAITRRIQALEHKDLSRQVEKFERQAQDMIARVKNDPRDLTQSRKFLTVYLEGAKDASFKFATLYTQTKDRALVEKYQVLLSDLQDNFSARSQRMLENDQADMDVEIKVLQDRLQREH